MGQFRPVFAIEKHFRAGRTIFISFGPVGAGSFYSIELNITPKSEKGYEYLGSYTMLNVLNLKSKLEIIISQKFCPYRF